MSVKHRNSIFLYMFLILSVNQVSFAESNKQGIYKSKDNILWMRCAIGQKFNQGKCEGTATQFDWFGAKNFAKNYAYGSITGWRLPTISELHALSVCSDGFTETKKIPLTYSKKKSVKNLCSEDSSVPTINESIFPNTPAGLFWSGTSDPLQNGFAWYTYFGGGHSSIYNMKSKNYIRLVKDLKK